MRNFRVNERPNESWVINELIKRFGLSTNSKELESIDITTSMSDLDDGCVLNIKKGTKVVLSSDYIRGREFKLFRLGLLDYFDIGFYLVAANLSDLAAMGAWPVGINLILRYPPDINKSQIIELINGIATACEHFGSCNLLGGDTGGATDLVLSATAVGITPNPLLRSFARIGDKIYIIGNPGVAGAALALALNGFLTDETFPKDIKNQLLRPWRRPKVFLHEGLTIAKIGNPIACQDTSDGLKTTLTQIAKSSNVSIVIDELLLNPDEILKLSAKKLNRDVLDLYLGASVDFGLVISAPQNIDIEEKLRIFPETSVNFIGKVINGEPKVYLKRTNGDLTSIPGVEYIQ